MNLSIRELNELIYCIGIARMHGQLLGTTVADTLDARLRAELDKRLATDLTYTSHFVSNEEADEDYRSTLAQDEQRYEKSKTKPFDKGTSQYILDYVENTGASTYTELNEFYKFVTSGSNSFSHILKNLRIPYKNRNTRRYLSKTDDGKYEVKLANPSNWIVKDYDYKTFNEAPYGE